MWDLAKETPVIVRFPEDGMQRMAVACFTHPKGVVFVDIGYDDPMLSFHPFHLLEGAALEYDEPTDSWNIGGVMLTRAPEDSLERRDYDRWKAQASRRATSRAFMKAQAARDLLLEEEDLE